LVAKSLVQADASTEAGFRYRMLETLREYSLERLTASGAEAAARSAHAAYYGRLGEQAVAEWIRLHSRTHIERLRPDLDNLRAALCWVVENRQAEAALRLSQAVALVLDQFGHTSEGRARIEAVLAIDVPPEQQASPDRARAFYRAADFAYVQADYGASLAHHRRSLEIFRALDDRAGIAETLNWMGSVARDAREHEAARGYLEEALALCRALGDRRGVGTALDRLGTLSHVVGDLAAAEAFHRAADPIFRDIGDRYYLAWSLLNQGYLALDRGEPRVALARCLESLAGREETGDRHGLIYSLTLFAAIAASEGAHERALRLYGSLTAACEHTGATLMSIYRDHLERWLAPSRQALGEDACAAAMSSGRHLALNQAIAEARGGVPGTGMPSCSLRAGGTGA
jgi:non-specific serine/threonine protein kinase